MSHIATQLKSFIVPLKLESSNNTVFAISIVNVLFKFILNQLFHKTVV
ncbi:hypothetical protein HOG21_07685 [bacterium]|nr:hypothetical protein [bacterium]